MKNYLYLTITLCFFVIGCSGIRIYSDEKLQKRTAAKFHYAKPFVLVEYNATKDGTIKTSIVYLPDYSETFYAKMNKGLGNTDLKLAFENGSIASIGTSSDNKILLSTGSLSNLISDLAKSPNAVDKEHNPAINNALFELYEIVSEEGKTRLKKIN
jgi:hypothetical protein